MSDRIAFHVIIALNTNLAFLHNFFALSLLLRIIAGELGSKSLLLERFKRSVYLVLGVAAGDFFFLVNPNNLRFMTTSNSDFPFLLGLTQL